PWFIMAQSFDDRDPRLLDMDAAVEFPPHKLVDGIDLINGTLTPLDHSATAQVVSYADMAGNSNLSPAPYPLVRAALPGWDNDPRRQGNGMVLHGATPALYQAWLERLIDAARRQPVGGEAIVCINAWNEWGEGAYLEPDIHFGAAFLNATSRAVAAQAAPEIRTRLLLVGHDAFPAGAQLLLLNLGRTLSQVQGVDIAFLLLGDGKLLPQYGAVAPTTVADAPNEIGRHLQALAAKGFQAAIVNSAASASVCMPLIDAGFRISLFIHELPRLLRERNLVPTVRAAIDLADAVVFGAPHVRDRFTELVPLAPDRTLVLPQGLYRPVTGTDRTARRDSLRVPAKGILAIGLGYADLRKGFDLFLQVWRLAHARDPSIHMLWVGDIDPTVHAYLGAEMAVAEATGTFHHVAFDHDGADWLVAADVFLLTSREDPLPTAVIEAMSAGLPSVAFEESGGVPDLLRECTAGVSVPLGDTTAMVRQMRALAARTRPAARTAIAARAREMFDFGRYASRVLAVAHPALLDITAVIPNYNYERYLRDRLDTVFGQT
ncbi:MAG: glycoside hydrolase family 99-like domain-containing protein, partial [Candidatus Saccharibacteria bacterium]|nr:glycoside hydrolase family 99-like domain-containing protein [Pseudorhodobacter sp.]